MIEEDAVHSKKIVGLSEVHHNPVGIQFCCPYKNNLKALLIPAVLTAQTDTHTSSRTQSEVHISTRECVRI